jgi:hypothetical protein
MAHISHCQIFIGAKYLGEANYRPGGNTAVQNMKDDLMPERPECHQGHSLRHIVLAPVLGGGDPALDALRRLRLTLPPPRIERRGARSAEDSSPF